MSPSAFQSKRSVHRTNEPGLPPAVIAPISLRMYVDLRGPTELEISGFEHRSVDIRGTAGGHGFGPVQMLATSLGLCTASVLDGYGRDVLKADLEDLRLVVRWAFGERPHRVARFDVEVHWPGAPAERLAAIQRAAEACTVHRTLEHPPELTTTVHLS
jgi:uncharacterized OsmC-like protein